MPDCAIETVQLVLSLFPGADLLGRAFESEGYCVVRGPDILQGQDIRNFHVSPGRFDGIIGGPPCQAFSVASTFQGTKAIDLIGEFVRIVKEAQPQWAVMENIWGARKSPNIPDWPVVRLCDFDCGGLTKRVRAFWFYGIEPAMKPVVKPGRRDAAYSVLATSWKDRKWSKRDRDTLPQRLPCEAAALQGFPGLADTIIDSLPAGMTPRSKEIFAVHMLGNGVPLALGRYIARHVRKTLVGHDTWQMTGLPLFTQTDILGGLNG